jgi:micrococcal nuclease
MPRLLDDIGNMWSGQGCFGQVVLLLLVCLVVGLPLGIVSVMVAPPTSREATRTLVSAGRPTASRVAMATGSAATLTAQGTATPSGAPATQVATRGPTETAVSEPSPTTTPISTPVLPSPTAESSPTLAAASPTPVPTPELPTPSPTVPVPTLPLPTATLPITVPARYPRVLATVVWAINGDTVCVSIEGQVYRVRYLGIDAPDPGTGRDADLATARNRELVYGQHVYLERDLTEKDVFHQMLRYVFLGDVFVNAELVREGLARAWITLPDTRYQEILQRLEAEAQQTGRGIWAPR